MTLNFFIYTDFFKYLILFFLVLNFFFIIFVLFLQDAVTFPTFFNIKQNLTSKTNLNIYNLFFNKISYVTTKLIFFKKMF